MKKILIIGAGRSASSLISYLLDHSTSNNWQITVGDMEVQSAEKKINGHPNGRAIAFDINNAEMRAQEIAAVDLVISMLPAFMHLNVAKDCLRLEKNLVTASYVSPEMKALDAEVKAKGLIFLNEIGLDPGIDHMSAMEIIDTIKEKGGEIESFKSYCGGLVAPESNDNPWGYKFTWNPRNVILAGQGTAQYLENGSLKFIPYTRIFNQTATIEVEGYGKFDAYANRDSLSYILPYQLQNVKTMLRGTLRYEGYCNAWDLFIKLGLTDDSFTIQNTKGKKYSELFNWFLPEGNGSIKERVSQLCGLPLNHESLNKLEWLGVFENETIQAESGTPAQLLQELLERKWVLKEQDLDMIVMQHQFQYLLNNKKHEITSSLVVKGKDQTFTAMAQTVGIPAAIATKLILQNKITLTGVQIPVSKAIYQPILAELKQLGIAFTETEKEL